MTEPIQVDYNTELDPLVEMLSKVKRPGDFYVTGSLEVPLPRLEIKGVGTISFPLPASQAKDLIRQAEQAPYGRGQETVVDPKVRKVWQVPADKVRIGGTSWEHTLSTILDRVAGGMGFKKTEVTAELYKLLLYDVGSFFQAHRDTEKAEGMFGTLVIVLPSFHKGGELVVRHAGREVIMDLRTKEVSEVTFAAFYADCEHE
ncbi:MAG TPA: 2OG-Fe(II) oxygenase, partial [Clostridia bacterium]|nr:2OG-Fe(II) oxygenase [Clostridia bacterium]